MISNFLLKINDEALANQYLLKRFKEILPMSAGISAFQILSNTIVTIISIVYNYNEYVLELWLGRIIGVVINIILLIFLYKYPMRMVPLIAALLELN